MQYYQLTSLPHTCFHRSEVMGKYFDIKRDLTYPHFCLGCLAGKPQSEMSSKDNKYCTSCQESLEHECFLKDRLPITPPQPVETLNNGSNGALRGNGSSVILSQLNNTGRGRKSLNLPKSIIKELHIQGMGSRIIATKLKTEHGIQVSYKTIQRILSGG